MDETKKAPNLRFKGFTNDWEQRKGKEIFSSKSEKGFPNLTVLSATQDRGMIPRNESGIDMKYDKKSLANYKKVNPGDFVVHLRSFQGGFAYSNLVGIVSPAYTVFSFKEPTKFNNYFWKEKFTSYNFIQLLKKVTYGVRDGRSISYSDFLTLKEKFPNKLEQRKIGTLLNQLEIVIAFQQQKLNKLDLLYKSLLQKLFAADNHKNPELRFKEFHNSWDMKKIGSLFAERNQKSANGQLLSVSIAKGVYPFDPTERKNNPSANKSNYKLVEENDIAYNSMRMWQGAEGVSYYNGIVSPAYTVIRPKEGNIPEFFAYMFKRADMLNKFKRYSQGLTSDTWNLKFPILQSINVKTTTNEEQKKIVHLFKAVEDTFNLQQKKLERYQQIKKFLLQQMFI